MLRNTLLQKVVALFPAQSLLHLCQILELIPSFWFLHLALRVSYQMQSCSFALFLFMTLIWMLAEHTENQIKLDRVRWLTKPIPKGVIHELFIECHSTETRINDLYDSSFGKMNLPDFSDKLHVGSVCVIVFSFPWFIHRITQVTTVC